MTDDRCLLTVGRSHIRKYFLALEARKMSNYKTLDAWQQSMQLVKEIYLITKTFPKEELYALTSQTRRAAVSVPSNIAEGVGRNYKKDTI